MFLRDLNIFHKKIDDFSADTAVMKLEWVKHSFVFMCVVGFSSLVISLVPLVIPNLILNILFVIFYTYFALRFIRFPRVLELAIPLFEPEQEPIIVQEPKSKTDVSPRHDWELLKKQLMNKKIYVRPGITIDTVASELGTGRSTLSTLIKTHEEVNFNVMINRLRIDEAQQLMRLNPAMSLAEVADHVGYTDQANFSRQFKLHAQVAPSVWRQNVIGSSN
jgi:AraC-like DNA-binding protein